MQEIRCSVCGCVLLFKHHTDESGDTYILVEPCIKCLNTEWHRGFGKAKDIGLKFVKGGLYGRRID